MYLVIPAAGVGSRFGANLPKTFVKLANGRSLLEQSVYSFLTFAISEGVYFEKVVISLNPDFLGEINFSQIQPLLKTPLGNTEIKFVEPGKETRQDSVFNCLEWIKNSTAEGELNTTPVFIHDAARPCFDLETFQKILHSLKLGSEAVIPGTPISSTIKRVNNFVSEVLVEQTIARDRVILAQTPQTFIFKLVYQAHLRAIETSYQGTDDSELVESQGVKVHVIRGSEENIKVTYPIDLDICNKVLEERYKKK